jgi:transpeptidase family protein
MKKLRWMLAVLALAVPLRPAEPTASSDRLFGQSAERILARDFPAPETSYLLLDARSGALLAARWESPQKPVPVGSLIKPFTALAYGAAHNYDFPQYRCDGRVCWLPRGHGRLGIEQAVAHSCNSYFLQLAAQVHPRGLEAVLARFELAGPAEQVPAKGLIGEGDYWRVSPLALARAYIELAHRRREEGVREVVDGMALSARLGTGAAVDRALGQEAALSKTGTAPCLHAARAPGDGYAMVLYPADSPRLALLVRQHGAPGSHAAAVAGEMLRDLQAGQP